jgi:dTDP-4-amino-4,6-dideoxygalactose transaminase
VTNRQSERLIRLPLWMGLPHAQQDKVLNVLKAAIKAAR